MNRAFKWVTPGFILQFEPREEAGLRIGYTVSKKVGNAVTRNAVKRRFRALTYAHLAQENANIVLIGRQGVATLPFKQLQNDLRWALKRVKQKI